jgi:biopolymer transport protein ExbB
MWGLSIFELFDRGGPVMWPILACSILGSAIVIDRTVALIWANLNYDRFISRLDGMIASGKLSEAQDRFRMSHKPLECVVAKYLQSFSTPRDLREKAVATEASRQLHRLERRLNWLAIVTHLSPLLGLLGTVAGLVSAFHEIDLGGGNARPGDLASGIWSALLTTVFGLSVALPCLAAYHLLEHRVDRFALEMEWTSAFLDESLLHATSSA